jgi:hypothetical protein
MKNTKFKKTLWALALVCLTSLAFISIAFSQSKKEKNEGKIHLKIEMEENGKTTKIDTTFDARDEETIERYLEEKGINKGRDKRVYLNPPVAPAPPPLPPGAFSFNMPDMDPMDFGFDFDFDSIPIRFDMHGMFSKENKEKLDKLKAEIKELKAEINSKITPELKKLQKELQEKREELRKEWHDGFKNGNFNFNWHDEDDTAGSNKFYYYWNSDDDEREGRLPGERRMKVIIDGEDIAEGEMKDCKVKVICCEVREEKAAEMKKDVGEKEVKIVLIKDKEEGNEKVIDKAPNEEQHKETVKEEEGKAEKPVVKTEELVAKTIEPVSDFSLNAKNVQLFPNPNDGNFTLSFELPAAGELSIKLLDGAGREVVNETITGFSGIFSKQYNIPLAKKGTYLLQLKQGERWMHKKIVVK